MPITKLKGSTQIKAGSLDSTVVKDSSLIPQDFSVFPSIASPLTVTQRDALTNVKPGTTIYNTDFETLDVWTGTAWVSFQAIAVDVQWDGGAPDTVFTGDEIDGGLPETEGYEPPAIDGGTV